MKAVRTTKYCLSAFVLVGFVLFVSAMSSPAAAQGPAEPLHVRIDRVIEQTGLGPVAAPVGDLDFARRLHLDLTGTLPTSSALRAFLADSSPDKRARLIDQLLASPEHARYFASVLDVMLMERRADKHVPAAEWQKYLFDSLMANKPFHELAKEILGADGTEGPMRPAAKFILDREVESNSLARDIGRVFFGMDLTCAQCHDHPAIDGFKQADYYGIYAFVNRAFLFTNKEKKVSIGEKADGDVNFTSVFTKEPGRIGPQLPGDQELLEPLFEKGEEYVTAPADNVRPVPKYSRQQKLAELVGKGTNRAFNRNIANRFWAQMMGRGLVEPLDMHHVDNPPSNGPLLDLLTDEIQALQFNLRAFLREIALSQAYQRGSIMPSGGYVESSTALASAIPNLEAEQQKIALVANQSTEAANKLIEAWKQAQKDANPIFDEYNKTSAAVAEALKGAEAPQKALVEAQKKQADKQAIAVAVTEAATKAAEAVAKLPEEKELAQAAEKFQAKAAGLNTELAALTKSVTDLTPAATAAVEKVNTAKQASTAARSKLEASNLQLAQLKTTARTAEFKATSEWTSAKQFSGRATAAKALVSYTTVANARNALQSTIASVQTDMQNRKATMEKLAAELPKRQTELTQAQQASEQANSALADARTKRDAKQSAVTTFAEVVAKAEAASQKLPEDAELKQAAQAVKTRSDQLVAELTQIQTGLASQEQNVKVAAERLATSQQALAALQNEMNTQQQAVAALEKQLQENTAKLAEEEQAVKLALEDLEQKWTQRFLVATLRPKTPEQMWASILQATGVVDNYRAAAEAEVNKTLPIDPNMPADPARLAARTVALEQQVHEKLKGTLGPFVNLFGHAGGQPQRDFYATADQALFFGNAGTLTGWIAPSGNNLTARLMKLEDPRAIAEEIYLSILTRLPDDGEIAEVTQALAARPAEKANVVQELAWALITSAEFRFIP